MLETFTGYSEAILDAKDQNTLNKMIHKVSIRAPEFQCHSKQSSDEIFTTEENFASIIKDVIVEMNDKAVGHAGDGINSL